MTRSARFDIATCAVDFAAVGRKIDTFLHVAPWRTRQGMHIHVESGWTISCVWGSGTYCEAGRVDLLDPSLPTPPTSATAEVAAWHDGGEMVDLLDGDAVCGWVTPAQVHDLIEAARQNDVDEMRRALFEGAESSDVCR